MHSPIDDILKNNKSCIQEILTIGLINILSNNTIGNSEYIAKDKNLNLNDSIVKSNITIDNNNLLKINNFVEIPKDILMYTFNYLDLISLINIEKTCRHLCIARNPNSIYQINYQRNHSFIYSHDRFSKLKSFKAVQVPIPYNDAFTFNDNCGTSLQKLQIRLDYPSLTHNDEIPAFTSINCAPYFQNITTFSCVPSPTRKFITKIIFNSFMTVGYQN